MATMTGTRILEVKHKTTYRYNQPVERSIHRIHLRPIQNDKQRILTYSLRTSPQVPIIEYEDVFGNLAARFEVTNPYTELTLNSHARVEIKDTDPFAFASVPIKRTFPIVWMPFQQIMLAPYLQPPELPDTQIEELFEYAMSFSAKNNNDLMETLFSINLTLFKHYKYTPGSTRITTSPYEVFSTKSGVCQDFSNLFICMARLLGIPARYVCGYIYTGNVGSARAQSDASHAWVELFIPNVGWKGFDPTNGVLPNTDHIRLVTGRHYLDATPTSGTIYSPAQETMQIDVEVTDVAQEEMKLKCA